MLPAALRARLSGLSDEADHQLDLQINTHRRLGWSWLELRKVDGADVTTLSDQAFDAALAKISAAGLAVSALSGPYGNWASRISDPFAPVLASARRTLARMRAHRIPFLRVMSWPNAGLDQDAWRDEAVARTRALAELAAEHGVSLVLENCDGWAAQSTEHFTEFLHRVDHPALRVVYDTGNPASHGQPDTWAWYQAALPWIAYIHIKAHSGRRSDTDRGRHVFPDDPAGASRVEETLAHLLARGYTGLIAIEPHLGTPQMTQTERIGAYLDYARRLETILHRISARNPRVAVLEPSTVAPPEPPPPAPPPSADGAHRA